MRLYFPVDLTGNLIMIEKLVSGGDLNRGPPDLQPRRANLCAIMLSVSKRCKSVGRDRGYSHLLILENVNLIPNLIIVPLPGTINTSIVSELQAT